MHREHQQRMRELTTAQWWPSRLKGNLRSQQPNWAGIYRELKRHLADSLKYRKDVESDEYRAELERLATLAKAESPDCIFPGCEHPAYLQHDYGVYTCSSAHITDLWDALMIINKLLPWAKSPV
jgi:hypothetical protein